ncbi:MotA/TolQ/ExbB proton channel family protein [Draconibacterium sp.]|nr:MotA/TolQ/ExbB proton channel family protein [Draconibacterium sp.]
MKELFYMGGPLFMGILTGLLIVLVAWAVFHFFPVFIKKEINSAKTKARLKQFKTIGTFALIVGILGQLIGLYGAFSAIEEMGGGSPAMLMGGLKVSMITTFYGIFIYLFSLLIWFIVDFTVSKKTE